MRFFLDANIPLSLKVVFRVHGEVMHANDDPRGGRTDQDIARGAMEFGAILVTRDLEFANPKLFPVGAHLGLIILRVPHFYVASQIAALVQRFLSKAPLSDLEGAITVVEPGRVRRLRRSQR